MSDVIEVAAGALPRVVLSVARNTDDLTVFPGQTYVVDSALSVCAGDTWDGTANTPPPPPAAPVPRSVSMRQARLALLGAGLLDEVTALIAAQSEAVQIEWEYATDIWRNRDLVATLGPALGLNDAQIDALFVAAKAIP